MKTKTSEIEKWRPYFEGIGFGDYMIDFSDCTPDAIAYLGRACKNFLEPIPFYPCDTCGPSSERDPSSLCRCGKFQYLDFSKVKDMLIDKLVLELHVSSAEAWNILRGVYDEYVQNVH